MHNFVSAPELFDNMAKKKFTVAVLSDQTEQACHKT
jgi:hypothetical protein